MRLIAAMAILAVSCQSPGARVVPLEYLKTKTATFLSSNAARAEFRIENFQVSYQKAPQKISEELLAVDRSAIQLDAELKPGDLIWVDGTTIRPRSKAPKLIVPVKQSPHL